MALTQLEHLSRADRNRHIAEAEATYAGLFKDGTHKPNYLIRLNLLEGSPENQHRVAEMRPISGIHFGWLNSPLDLAFVAFPVSRQKAVENVPKGENHVTALDLPGSSAVLHVRPSTERPNWHVVSYTNHLGKDVTRSALLGAMFCRAVEKGITRISVSDHRPEAQSGLSYGLDEVALKEFHQLALRHGFKPAESPFSEGRVVEWSDAKKPARWQPPRLVRETDAGVPIASKETQRPRLAEDLTTPSVKRPVSPPRPVEPVKKDPAPVTQAPSKPSEISSHLWDALRLAEEKSGKKGKGKPKGRR